MRLNRTGKIQWRFHSKISNTIFHNLKVDCDYTAHFNSATKGNLTITLRKVQISDTELCASNMNWEKHFTTTRKVLDITVSTMLWSSGDSSSAFKSDFFFDGGGSTSCVDVFGVGWLSNDSVKFVGSNELSFSLVPCCEYLLVIRSLFLREELWE